MPVSSTIAGVVCKDGVLLATEKIVINKMMISGTDKRVYSVTKNIGSVSYALLFWHAFVQQVINGLTPDGRALMYRARDEAKQYEDMYGIKCPGKILADRIAGQAHMRTM